MKDKMLEKAKILITEIREKWENITNKGYLCYDNNIELASEIIYKLFNKDIFNDIETYYKISAMKENGNIFKVLVKVDSCLYFQFNIITKYGIDIPQKIDNGKFRILKEVPNGWKDILELWEELQENEE